jgi:hypothetical protein
MPNDFESRALQKLLGLNQEMVAPMIPDFLNAMNMMPGISGADDQLQALAGMVPPDIYSSLASLLAPPEVANAGVTPPQIQDTGLVRRQAIPRAAEQTQRPQTGRTDLQQRQRDAQKMEARRRRLETQQKKGRK